jgi:hypothetical protein
MPLRLWEKVQEVSRGSGIEDVSLKSIREPDGLTEMAINVARRIKFIPATKDGRPVSTYLQLEFNLY